MITVIICSIDNVRFDAVSKQYAAFFGEEPHEIIRISDAKGLCEGYNRGFAQSKGEWLIFSHDDIEFLAPNLAPRLKKHLEKYEVIGVAGTDRLISQRWFNAGPPHIFGQVVHFEPKPFLINIYGAPTRAISNIQAVDGLFIACRREVVEKIPWDEKTFGGFHCYDVDFTFRAYLAGFKLAVACDLPILHASVGNANGEYGKWGELFIKKHAGRLAKLPVRLFRTTQVHVESLQDALTIMTPEYWPD